MTDLIDDPRMGENAPEFSVSEISSAVKRALEGEFGRVRVKGEVGRVVKARSGHLYFDIKDDRNALACTSWKGQVSKLSVIPEEGMEVVVTGKMTAYGGQSKYNLNVDDVSVAGVGALMAMLEKRKTMLAAEGLFDPSRKQPLPFLPEIIGVVTSPTGAVIRDILHRLRDRFPRKVLVWPVAVQGASCAAEVARAIDGFNAMTHGGALPRPDLLIVARGGGAIEDLWGFNEEVVARSAAASTIPLISAVGHETDTTLIDFVSDQRAPTPTAAAELAVPVRLDLLAWSEGMGARSSAALANSLSRKAQRAKDLARALPRPDMILAPARQRLDTWDDRLPNALRTTVQRRQVGLAQISASLKPRLLAQQVQEKQARLVRVTAGLRPQEAQRVLTQNAQTLTRLGDQMTGHMRDKLTRLSDRLTNIDRLRETLGYKETLRRGFAVVRADGDIVTRKSKLTKGAAIEIEFADGTSKIASTSPKPVKKTKTSPPEQGSLL